MLLCVLKCGTAVIPVYPQGGRQDLIPPIPENSPVALTLQPSKMIS